MTEYIDKSTLLRSVAPIYEHDRYTSLTFETAKQIIVNHINSLPTIDIVQCKDCVNFHKYGFKLEYTECKHFDCDVCEDGFCAWGERKEVGE